MTKFTYIDLFSGIGGFRIALDELGGQSVGFSEIDKRALETYKTNFNDPEGHDLGDVTKIQELPNVDLVVGGVPCQSWSVAGKKRGFDDPRGKLWWDAIRVIKMSQPKAFIFENVKGLMDPRNRANLELIIDSFADIGYKVRYQLLNSFDFGVPQNRSRIFIVGFREDMLEFAEEFNYPEAHLADRTVGDLLEGFKLKSILKHKFDPHLLHGKMIPRSRNAFQKIDELNDFFIFCDTRNGHSTIHSWDLYDTTEKEKRIGMAIMSNRRKKRYGDADGNPMSVDDIAELVQGATAKDLDKLVDKRILKKTPEGKYDLLNSKNSSGIDGVYRVFLPNSGIFSTLTATGTRDFIATEYLDGDDPSKYKQQFIDKIFKPKKFRQVSSREAARIQGFPDTFICHDSDFSAQKQFGNAVSPPVVKALAEEVLKTGVFKSTLMGNEHGTEAANTGTSEGLDALQPNLQPS
ncbi:TPA: DNA (cytosine-5-)-methyltransferase [Candidatus Saccharibacteria bacterium]|nr:DNA (cytosine-5-)-methyltransferase [Candidatus Saccharibacteria bacterium]|tara:strand:+ start:486 stop:1874 length:1389 start_codon:yes stop_codon:yes gene_type:complete